MSDLPPTNPPTAPATGPAAQPPATPTPSTPPPTTPQPTDPAATADQLGDGGIKALEAERAARRDAEAKLKELEPLAAKAKELEEANMSETQRLQAELDAAKADGSMANSSLLRLDVALDKAPAGMDVATARQLAGRLQGATREELEADAAVLFAQFVGQSPATPPPTGAAQTTPVENLKPGALPTTPTAPLPEQIAVAEAAGDLGLARQLKTQQFMELQKKTT